VCANEDSYKPVTYYPLKKHRSEIDPPSTATTDCGDEKDFIGPKFFSGRAAVDIQQPF